LNSSHVLKSTKEKVELHFGSTYPTFIVGEKPSNFVFPGSNKPFHYEVLHVQDLNFIQKFVKKCVEPYNYEDVYKLGWEVFCEGET